MVGVADRVGFIGLGIMGSRMAANLRRAGFDLTVWNRTSADRRALGRARTARRSPRRPRRLAPRSDVVITMVVDGAAGGVRPARGARVSAARRDGPPALHRHVDDRAERRSRDRGGARRARRAVHRRTGDRLLAEGRGRNAHDHGRGEEADFERARPLFEAMGELIVHVGPLGHGQMVKLINNALAAINTAAAARGAAAREARRRGPRRARRGARQRAPAARRCWTSRRGPMRATTTRRCSSSSTCSKTCASASMRQRRLASGWGLRRRVGELLEAAKSRGSASRTSRRCWGARAALRRQALAV